MVNCGAHFSDGSHLGLRESGSRFRALYKDRVQESYFGTKSLALSRIKFRTDQSLYLPRSLRKWGTQ